MRSLATAATAWEILTYSRYSSDQQNPRSIVDQQRQYPETCLRFGVPPGPFVAFQDAARTGKTLARRDGLHALLEHVARPVPRGVRRIVVCEAVDRFARRILDAFALAKQLLDAGVRIITTDGMDSDQPEFKVRFTVGALVADMENENRRTHTRRGLQARVAEGKFPSRPPFGYRLHSTYLVVEPDEAEIVRRVFRSAAAGVGARTVARRLVDEGLVPRWSDRQVRCMLVRRLYRGEVWYGGQHVRSDEALRIVSDDLWHRAQAAVERRKAALGAAWQEGSALARGGALARRHLLSGLFRCGECGRTIAVVAKKREDRYYGCPSARNHHGCTAHGLMAAVRLERAVVDAVVASALDSDAVAHVVARVEALVAATQRARGPERCRMEHALRDVSARLRNCVEHVEQHGGSAAVQARIAELEAQRVALVERVATLERATPEVTVLRSAVTGYLHRTADDLQGADVERARAALAQVVTGGTVVPRAEGRGHRVTFTVAPLGILHEVAVPGGKGANLSPPVKTRRR